MSDEIPVTYHCPACDRALEGTIARGTSFDEDRADCPDCGTRLNALRVSPARFDMTLAALRFMLRTNLERAAALRELIDLSSLVELPLLRAQVLHEDDLTVLFQDGPLCVADVTARVEKYAFEHIALMAHVN